MANYWRVTSYGYPNPFGGNKAQRTWALLKSFAEQPSYSAVKEHWATRNSDERLTSNAVESRKASFEEFGLLYVLAGSDRIVVTPGGRQLLEAAEREDKEEFAWIGINLLMRYPLQGPPRAKVTSNVSSDFPIYNFIYAALCELENYVWFEELLRVLGNVTTVSGAQAAVALVKELRSGASTFETMPEMPDIKGAYYNSMNQVLNHIGLAGLVLSSERGSTPYQSEYVRKDSLISGFRETVRLAIGQRSDANVSDDCVTSEQFIVRMPVIPIFSDEQEYFEYLGSRVPSRTQTLLTVEQKLPQVLFGQESVSILSEGVHYEAGIGSIVGEVAMLCRVSRGQRLVLSHDADWTYKVKEKYRIDGGKIKVDIARSKPISNVETIFPYFLGERNG